MAKFATADPIDGVSIEIETVLSLVPNLAGNAVLLDITYDAAPGTELIIPLDSDQARDLASELNELADQLDAA